MSGGAGSAGAGSGNSEQEDAQGRPLPRQHGRRAVAERPGLAPPRRRREAGRLRALPPPPRGGLVARPLRRLSPPPDRAVARVLPAPAPHGRLPLLLRPHARPEVAAVSDPSPAA